jgi:acid phosphatase
MHDGSIAEGDDWLERHLGPYVEWSATNNGLLLFTFDEDNGSEFNRIPIFLHGPGVRAGEYGDVINHYDVLRTIEEMYGLPHTGATEAAGGMSTAIWIEAR